MAGVDYRQYMAGMHDIMVYDIWLPGWRLAVTHVGWWWLALATTTTTTIVYTCLHRNKQPIISRPTHGLHYYLHFLL
mgnify:CR=1 FL=1